MPVRDASGSATAHGVHVIRILCARAFYPWTANAALSGICVSRGRCRKPCGVDDRPVATDIPKLPQKECIWSFARVSYSVDARRLDECCRIYPYRSNAVPDHHCHLHVVYRHATCWAALVCVSADQCTGPQSLLNGYQSVSMGIETDVQSRGVAGQWLHCAHEKTFICAAPMAMGVTCLRQRRTDCGGRQGVRAKHIHNDHLTSTHLQNRLDSSGGVSVFDWSQMHMHHALRSILALRQASLAEGLVWCFSAPGQ